MRPLRCTGVLCCAEDSDGSAAIVTPEKAVLNKLRRVRLNIGGECTGEPAAWVVFHVSNKGLRDRSPDSPRTRAFFALVTSSGDRSHNLGADIPVRYPRTYRVSIRKPLKCAGVRN